MRYQLTCEGVRCFRKPQRVDIAPLTLLVGENSSGKSTLLALNRIAWDAASRGTDGIFNNPPFLLGAFDQILTTASGQREFRIGVVLESSGSERKFEIQTVWREAHGQPELHHWEVSSPPAQTSFYPDARGPSIRVGRRRAKEFEGNGKALGWKGLALQMMDFNLAHGLIGNDYIREAIGIGFDLRSTPQAHAVAPVRSSPSRTYDSVDFSARPDGSHIPLELAQMAASNPAEWRRVREGLAAFGEAAGLFDGIEIVRKGRKVSDPFQVQVRFKSNLANLLDVGYGVAQVLPIIVEVVKSVPLKVQKQGFTQQFLMQQPEVHLHPKAQAELGTFFAKAVKNSSLRFLIETHSDHLIDRVRMALRDGILTPADVSLLYFERKNNEVTIHSLKLDADGRITDAPDSYRQFFLHEAGRVLGF